MGMSCSTAPMLSMACVSNHATIVTEAVRTKGSVVRRASRNPATPMAANSAMTSRDPRIPSSSPTTA